MNALWTKLVVFRPGHVAFAETLVNYKDYLGRNLSAEKGCFFHTHFFPFGKVLWGFEKFDAGWSL